MPFRALRSLPSELPLRTTTLLISFGFLIAGLILSTAGAVVVTQQPVAPAAAPQEQAPPQEEETPSSSSPETTKPTQTTKAPTSAPKTTTQQKPPTTTGVRPSANEQSLPVNLWGAVPIWLGIASVYLSFFTKAIDFWKSARPRAATGQSGTRIDRKHKH